MKLRIGTRKSALALWQANYVSEKLQNYGVETELVEIESFGDREQDIPIHKLGDKGVFTKALDMALLEKEIDLAVHSLKDVPSVLPKGLSLAAVPKRAHAADVIVRPKNYTETENDESKTIATGSIRRTAFWKNRFPEDQVVGLRGNVPTRVQKLDSNNWDGAVLAYAGLERIGLANRISEVLDWMIPAPSQGAIGIISRDNDTNSNLYKKIEHAESRICVEIERAFLNQLEAGCSSPVGGNASIDGGRLYFKGAVLAVGGAQKLDIERSLPMVEANPKKGNEWARVLIDQGASDLMQTGESND